MCSVSASAVFVIDLPQISSCDLLTWLSVSTALSLLFRGLNYAVFWVLAEEVCAFCQKEWQVNLIKSLVSDTEDWLQSIVINSTMSCLPNNYDGWGETGHESRESVRLLTLCAENLTMSDTP